MEELDLGMEEFDLGLEGGESADSELNPAETRKRSLQKCVDVLAHSSRCQAGNCDESRCGKMKRVIEHTTRCKRKANGGCPICKQLTALSSYHTKICKENMCSVPFCADIKNKIKQQQAAQRVQQARLLMQRVRLMQQAKQPVGTQLSASAGRSAISVTSKVFAPVSADAAASTQEPTMAGSLLTVARQVSADAPGHIDNMMKAYAALGLQYNPNTIPPSAQINQPLQIQGSHCPRPQQPKEWHAMVSVDLRKHLIQKLVDSIFPNPGPQMLNDPRMENLLRYATKVESEMFTLANSQDEYYQMLAEKVYDINRELEEKRRQRQRHK